MDALSVMSQNLLSPPVLFFGLGILAGLLKSDLTMPENMGRYLGIYLMMAIGFKGGVAIAATEEMNGAALSVMAVGVALSFLQPFLGYVLLRMTTQLKGATIAALAAHYGSVSIVTFATALAFLKMAQVPYGGYMVAVFALMEAPAILSGLFIAHRVAPETAHHPEEERRLSREIFTNGSILLLLGAFFIGWVTGPQGMEKVAGFLEVPFQGFLCLFLLDMGLVVAHKAHELRRLSFPLILFGMYMPLLGALLGFGAGQFLGVESGTTFLLMVLAASASYIAVPAAMRLALPEAEPGIYMPMSLAITFPFNVVLGIPLYYGVVMGW